MLGVESGFQYAAARLLAEPGYPVADSSRDRRGDDWECRDPWEKPFQGLLNPSYSHGEPWNDDGDGIFESGEAPAADLDGDGRFSAWSGRIRGSGAVGERFSLRIAAGAMIPVNAEPEAGITRLLDSLGALLLPENPDLHRVDLPPGEGPGESIKFSRLGQHVMTDRPQGGFRSLKEIEDRLVRIGYSIQDRARILPYLDLGPYSVGESCMMHALSDGYNFWSPYAPIEIAGADPALLQALWMYAGVRQSDHLRMAPGINPAYEGGGHLPGQTPYPSPPYGIPGVRSGGALRFSQLGKLMIYPDEAEALAVEADAFLRGPNRGSWLAFREHLVSRAGDLFGMEGGWLAAAGYDQTARDWVRAKADLAFFWACPMELPLPYMDISNWLTWGIPHEVTALAEDGTPVTEQGPFYGIKPGPDFLDMNRPSGEPLAWYDEDGELGQEAQVPYWFTGNGTLHPLGVTLAPISRYRILSLGRSGGGAVFEAERQFRTYERLEFTSQMDFESMFKQVQQVDLDGDGELDLDEIGLQTVSWHTLHRTRQGLDVHDPDPRARRPGPDYPAVVTLPVWNLRGAPDPIGWMDYSRRWGAVGLAARQFPSFGACVYWPNAEDWNGSAEASEIRSLISSPVQQRCTLAYPNYASPWEMSMATPMEINEDIDWQESNDIEFYWQILGGGFAGYVPSAPYFDCPLVRRAGDTGHIEHFTIMFWDTGAYTQMDASGVVERSGDRIFSLSCNPVGGSTNGEISIKRNLSRERAEESRQFVTYSVEMKWPNAERATPVGESTVDFGRYQLYASAKLDAFTLHEQNLVTLVFDKDHAGDEWLILYVNDREACRVRDTRYSPDKSPKATSLNFPRVVEQMACRGDDLRMFSTSLDAASVAAAYQAGRFLRPDAGSLFKSPVYSLDSLVSLGACGWTGIPDGFPGLEKATMEVRVHLFSDVEGGEELPGSPVVLTDPRRLGDLSFPGLARSFSYEVRFISPGLPLERFYASPIFEGIWFASRSRGRAPLWSD